MFKFLRKLFGKTKRQHRKWVMNMVMVDNGDYAPIEMREFLRRHTPLITQSEYQKLSPDLQRLFVKVGGAK